MKTVRDRQRRALEMYKERCKLHEITLATDEKELAAWKRDKHTLNDPPEKPEAPTARRLIVSDVTVEALAPFLQENPRGVLLAADELKTWLGSFDKYTSGKGGDVAHWLSMHSGDSLLVDRRHGNPRTIYVESAAVSIVGGIQPAILHRALGTEHRESGLAARLLLASPPRRSKRWSEAFIDPAVESWVGHLFDVLYTLEQEHDAENDRDRPVLVRMSPEAKLLWVAFYNDHAQEQRDLVGELAASWSKLEESVARIALVLHLAQIAAGPFGFGPADPPVSAGIMQSAIRIVGWFKHEAMRLYDLLSESDEDRDARRLAEWIEQRGGAVTAREVQMGCRWLREAGVAEKALDGMVKSEVGQWVLVSAGGDGGRPKREFRLPPVGETHVTPDGTPITPHETGCTPTACPRCALLLGDPAEFFRGWRRVPGVWLAPWYRESRN